MKVTIFTANQPRHLALIKEIAKIADKVYVVQECKTVLPGYRKDFYSNSDIMKEYFSKVMEAEKEIFGELDFLPLNCHVMGLNCGDVSYLPLDIFGEALNSDYYIVFGASYIKGALIDFLIEHRALNIHMGVSPYFRGCSCNFWAIYDGYPEMVGATIHLLSKGLDSGDILYHAFPGGITDDPFKLGMLAVYAAIKSLCVKLCDSSIFSMNLIKQNTGEEIRYARNNDFTDEIAQEYLSNLPSKSWLKQKIENRNLKNFINPVVWDEEDEISTLEALR